MELHTGKWVVFSDDHACPEKSRAIERTYGDSIDGAISLGDSIDGPDTRATIDQHIAMGIILVRGNHEQHAIDATSLHDEEARFLAASNLWPRVHEEVLQSYGIYPSIPTPGNALRLRDKMGELGHLDYLLGSVAFVEGDDFVGIHAEVSEDTWAQQKGDLESFMEYCLDRGPDALEMPLQFGEGLKKPSQTSLAVYGLQKTLLTGHFHLSARTAKGRYLDDGHRILLANWVKNDFVVCYETWNRRLNFIDLNETTK